MPNIFLKKIIKRCFGAQEEYKEDEWKPTCHRGSWHHFEPPGHHTGPFLLLAGSGSCPLPARTAVHSLPPPFPCTAETQDTGHKIIQMKITVCFDHIIWDLHCFYVLWYHPSSHKFRVLSGVKRHFIIAIGREDVMGTSLCFVHHVLLFLLRQPL